MRVFLVFLACVVYGTASPVNQEDSVLKLVANQFVNCVDSDLSLCLKENALKVTERLGTVRKLSIIDGVTIINNSPKEARSLDSLPSDPESRNKLVTERLWEKSNDLLQQGELELSYSGGDEEESRAIGTEEGRGKKKEKKKKLKMLIPLLLLAKAKAIAIVVLSLVVIAASLFKIALMAKIAFIVKAITIIKALLHKKHAEEEHGWAPVEEHHGHGGWEGGWSRSKNDAGSLAYSHYRK